MTITTTLTDADGGTHVLAVHEGLPRGVPIADNEAGWQEVWELGEENPPLAARKALALADAQLQKTVQREYEGLRVELDQIALVQTRDKWFWDVHYEWYPIAGGASGIAYDFHVLILMDGTIAEPRPIKSNSPRFRNYGAR